MADVNPQQARGRRTGRSSPGRSSADSRDPWPADFGRDGVSGLVSPDRAMRARDVSRPDPEAERLAGEALADLLARLEGRRWARRQTAK